MIVVNDLTENFPSLSLEAHVDPDNSVNDLAKIFPVVSLEARPRLGDANRYVRPNQLFIRSSSDLDLVNEKLRLWHEVSSIAVRFD